MSEILSEDYLSRWERALEGEPLSQVAPICVGEIHKFIASHRALQAERDALKVELAERKDRFHADALEPRGLDPERACEKCRGFGVTMYASTATWRGGHGGQAITQDVCCHCWGSGDAKRPWKSWRSIDALQAELAAKEQLYHELLYQVGMKYPNESRHETALRYLKRAEQHANEPAQCAKEDQP